MRVRIVCYEDLDQWILGKFALKLRENLLPMGVACDIAKVPDPSADINHHIIYFDYDGRHNSTDTVMITHIDTDWKLDRLRRQLEVADLGICMSSESVHRLSQCGIPREKLCYVLPAHDQVMKPRPFVIGLTSKIHGDGRKREFLLPQLAARIDPGDFAFRIMGAGWEPIVQTLRGMGFTVDYHDAFDYGLNQRLVPTFDYYLYLGLDEGAMGFIDALAAGVPTIVTPQGYHLDAPGGIIHPFATLEELVAVFQGIAQRRQQLLRAVETWTWKDYAAKHAELWRWLLAGRDASMPATSRYRDGLSSVAGRAQAESRPAVDFKEPDLFLGSTFRQTGTPASAPRSMPSALADEFTMGGRMRTEEWYLDESGGGHGVIVNDASTIEAARGRIRRREQGSYGLTDKFLYEALSRHDIRGLDVVVMGSEYPWYEAMCLEFGARSCTVIEYRKIQCNHPNIRTLTPDEFRAHPEAFDAAFSISSFEHDGLGRYGDPVDPNGDLAAMQDMKRLVRKGGLLFLAVPMGRDIVVWNAHRVYGRHRFPLLVKNWELAGCFGADDSIFDHPTIGAGDQRNYIQPVVVLRNEHPESRERIAGWQPLAAGMPPLRLSRGHQESREAPVFRKPRILLIADVPNWIFERHARTMQKRIGDEFEFEIIYAGQPFDEGRYDLIHPLEWGMFPPKDIPDRRKWVTGIRSHISWNSMDLAGFCQVLEMKYQRVYAVSKRLVDIFRPHLPGIEYVTHGVDTAFFRPDEEPLREPGKIRVGWAGNRKSSAKGFEEFIEPLGRLPGVELVFCGYSDTLLTMDQMRDFYTSIDVYVCSSSTEGSNNSLLEAAAMERAIVTTDVGTVPEYLEDGESALIIERSADAIARAVERLRDDMDLRIRLGRKARESVVANFDWSVRIDGYRQFFRGALAEAGFYEQTGAAPGVIQQAFLFEPDWGGAGWVEVLLSYLQAFEPGEPVALVLPLDPSKEGSMALEEAQQLVLQIVVQTGRETFPDVILADGPEELLQTLRGCGRIQWIPAGRGCVEGLDGPYGTRLAEARKQMVEVPTEPQEIR